jgi:glutaredoxin 2
VLALYQAEWCPFSSRVRETLTEYGIDFIARQVAADRVEREDMRRAIGTDAIPVLVLEDGTLIEDWQEIIAYIHRHYERRPDGDRHRQKWFLDAPRRDPKHVLT